MKLHLEPLRSRRVSILAVIAALIFLVFGWGGSISGALALNVGSIWMTRNLRQSIPDDACWVERAFTAAEEWSTQRTQVGLGRLAFQRGNYQVAIDSLTRAWTLDTSDKMAGYFLGLAYSRLANVEDALDSFVAVGAYKTILDWSVEESNNGQSERSELILQRLVALTEGHSPETVWLAKLELVERSRPSGECKRISRRLWEMWEDYQRTGYGPPLSYFAQMFYNTGQCFSLNGSILSGQAFRRAQQDYEACLQAIPNYTWISMNVYQTLAQGALTAREYDDAKTWADRGLHWYPDDALLRKFSRSAAASKLENAK